MKINIPKPCNENWNKMKPDEKGRFCSVCSKSVHDFSNISDAEIIDFFSNTKDEVCGNFNATQLNRNLDFSFINSFLAKFAVGLMLTSGGWVSVQAQECTSKDSIPKEIRKFKGKIKRISSKEIKENEIDAQMHIRGGSYSTIKDNTPLYIIDGKEVSKEVVKKLDSDKVKSIEVLKDEKAMAIYGSKAHAGVIIIITKK